MNIGWLSASPAATTGYGTQSLEICDRLQQKYNVICIAQTGDMIVWGARLDVDTPSGGKLKVVSLADLHSAADIINEYYVDEFDLDIVIGFMDAFGLEFLNQLKIPVIGWIPIDGPFTDDWAHYVRNFYKVTTYSRFGYKELLKFFPPSKVDYIPHSIPSDFRPRDPQKIRGSLSQTHGIPEDAFLVVNAGANIGPRKELPLMMETFARFVRNDHPDAHLYLHTNANQQSPRGYDLIKWRRYIGMEEHIHFPFKSTIFNPATNEELSYLYNAADIYWQNSVAEGFGLPIAEAMACGTPALVPDNSSQRELLEYDSKYVDRFGPSKKNRKKGFLRFDRGIVFDSLPSDVYKQIPVYVPQLPRYPIPDQECACQGLEYFYKHPHVVEEMGKSANGFIEKYHRIDYVYSEWVRALHSVEEEIGMFHEMKKVLAVN